MNAPWRVITAALAIVLVAGAGVAVSAPSSSDEGGGRKIVMLRPGSDIAEVGKRLERAGGVKLKELALVDAVVMNIPNGAAAKALAADGAVLRVEDDVLVQALGRPAKPQPAEVLPWGIHRIGADSVWASNTADPIKVAVIDTGIDTTHPDLAANVKGGFSAVGYTTSYKDDNGHGTHVAGTIGSVDDEIGAVGVAPQVDLYGVKVLDKRGSGYLSDIIEGLDWSIANGMQVVNMSLGTSSYSSSLDLAVQRVAAAGVVQVAAAGNSGPGAGTVNYPARFSQVISVAAVDSNDAVASFSSRGPEVDLAAPGVGVYSTYKGGVYQTLSGTSMASPHVAGTAALVLSTPVGLRDADADGVWDPTEVQAALQATAQDLGAVGVDTSYGHGLVRADLAVAP